MTKPDWNELIPELKDWNNGAGIDAESWIGCTGTFQLAIGYSLIFWPQFVEHDDMVLRAGYNEESLGGFMQQHRGNKSSVEAVMNHLHLDSIQYLGCPDATPERLAYLGNVLKSIYEVKLRNDFPNRTFVVSLNDSPKEDISKYQLTFYQPPYEISTEAP
jgi:hypothetical protein